MHASPLLPTRRLAPLALLALTALLLGGCASDEETVTDPAAVAEVRVYEVFGMDCPGCHGGLEKLVHEIPGVATARASWQERTLHVGIAPGHDVADRAILAAVARANFTAGERLE